MPVGDNYPKEDESLSEVSSTKIDRGEEEEVHMTDAADTDKDGEIIAKSDATTEVFDSEFKYIYEVPSHLVVHLPPSRLNITRLVVCRNYRARDSASCTMGENCKFVHVDVDYNQLEAHPIHVNYIWRHEDRCTYPRLPPGDLLEVFAIAEGTPDRVASGRLLRTIGALEALEVLKTRGSPSSPHDASAAASNTTTTAIMNVARFMYCAAFATNRMCKEGENCLRAHVVYVDPNYRGEFRRAPAQMIGANSNATGNHSSGSGSSKRASASANAKTKASVGSANLIGPHTLVDRAVAPANSSTSRRHVVSIGGSTRTAAASAASHSHIQQNGANVSTAAAIKSAAQSHSETINSIFSTTTPTPHHHRPHPKQQQQQALGSGGVIPSVSAAATATPAHVATTVSADVYMSSHLSSRRPSMANTSSAHYQQQTPHHHHQQQYQQQYEEVNSMAAAGHNYSQYSSSGGVGGDISAYNCPHMPQFLPTSDIPVDNCPSIGGTTHVLTNGVLQFNGNANANNNYNYNNSTSGNFYQQRYSAPVLQQPPHSSQYGYSLSMMNGSFSASSVQLRSSEHQHHQQHQQSPLQLTQPVHCPQPAQSTSMAAQSISQLNPNDYAYADSSTSHYQHQHCQHQHQSSQQQPQQQHVCSVAAPATTTTTPSRAAGSRYMQLYGSVNSDNNSISNLHGSTSLYLPGASSSTTGGQQRYPFHLNSAGSGNGHCGEAYYSYMDGNCSFNSAANPSFCGGPDGVADGAASAAASTTPYHLPQCVPTPMCATRISSAADQSSCCGVSAPAAIMAAGLPPSPSGATAHHHPCNTNGTCSPQQQKQQQQRRQSRALIKPATRATGAPAKGNIAAGKTFDYGAVESSPLSSPLSLPIPRNLPASMEISISPSYQNVNPQQQSKQQRQYRHNPYNNSLSVSENRGF